MTFDMLAEFYSPKINSQVYSCTAELKIRRAIVSYLIFKDNMDIYFQTGLIDTISKIH